jgi:hypothetical protein
MSQSVILRPDEDGNLPTVSVATAALQEQLNESHAVAGVLTFAAPISVIELYNMDAVNAGTFTVNGIVITLPAGKGFKDKIGGVPSDEVTVAGSTSYTVGRYA